ncbi:MAG: hypothetical protein KAU38_08385 [Desulfobacterales bacterium]|nr:hypothetical protein [Desulfobacterales bacterium]
MTISKLLKLKINDEQEFKIKIILFILSILSNFFVLYLALNRKEVNVAEISRDRSGGLKGT